MKVSPASSRVSHQFDNAPANPQCPAGHGFMDQTEADLVALRCTYLAPIWHLFGTSAQCIMDRASRAIRMSSDDPPEDASHDWLENRAPGRFYLPGPHPCVDASRRRCISTSVPATTNSFGRDLNRSAEYPRSASNRPLCLVPRRLA